MDSIFSPNAASMTCCRAWSHDWISKRHRLADVIDGDASVPMGCRISLDLERRSSPKRKLWAGYPADVMADVQADVLGKKLSPHRSECRKIKFFRVDVLDRVGLAKTLRNKRSGEAFLLRVGAFFCLQLSFFATVPYGAY